MRRRPFFYRVVGLVYALVWAAMDRDGSLASRRSGCVDFAGAVKCARDLDAKVAQYRRTRLCRLLVEKNVVAISPQARRAANKLPDLI